MPTHDYVLGIDPGKAGAVAVISADRRNIKVYRHKAYSDKDLYELLLGYTFDHSKAYLEKVHAMPKQGVTSSFNFGERFGFIKGVLTAIGMPFELTPAQKWQQGVSLGNKTGEYYERKKRQYQAAQQLFPGVCKAMDDADALLIAEYGWRLENR